MKKKSLLLVLTLIVCIWATLLTACNNNSNSSLASTVSSTKSLSNNNISSQEVNEEKTYITITEAKQIALTHSNLTSESVTFTKAITDYDDGIMVYDIEFIYDYKEYDYEINAISGEIIKVEIDVISNSTTNTSEQTTYITLDEAKNIALNALNFTTDDVTFTKAVLDYENRISVYEIEFVTDEAKYEFEINATNGIVMQMDFDEIKSITTEDISTTNHIGIEQAKTIALAHAQIEVINAIFTKSKLDFDDGIYIYEIEFIADNYEYEFEINATTGSILEFDKER